jgi:hypothetical protein
MFKEFRDSEILTIRIYMFEYLIKLSVIHTWHRPKSISADIKTIFHCLNKTNQIIIMKLQIFLWNRIATGYFNSFAKNTNKK